MYNVPNVVNPKGKSKICGAKISKAIPIITVPKQKPNQATAKKIENTIIERPRII
jgi:hypothetical protein